MEKESGVSLQAGVKPSSVVDASNEANIKSNTVGSQPVEYKTNFVVRLFRGDISLPITYWVFGVLIGNM